MKASHVPTDGRHREFGGALWTDPPGRGWADGVHPVDARLLPAEGEIERTVQGRTGRPTLGEEAFGPAGVAHTVRNGGGTTRRWGYGYRPRPPVDAPVTASERSG